MIMKKHRTTKASNNWLEFIEVDKVVAGFGITKESRIKYNRLRELWIHHDITLEELQNRISNICA